MDFLKGVYYGVLEFDPQSIAFALLILIVVLSFVRAMFNLAIVGLLACVVLIGVMDYSPQDIFYKAQSIMEDAKISAIKAIEPILESQLENADVRYGEDGTYEILASDVKIVGKKGEPKINIYYKNETLVLDINEFSKGVDEALSEISEVETPSK